jgi:phosphotransferase system  glucose/maltose/N-acetylglucosamine-specific IIC component
VFITGATVVGTGVGGAVATWVGAMVGAVVATGVAGWDVHPASKIPINRIARRTRIFFMHPRLLLRYIIVFYYYTGKALTVESGSD